jgi:diguanylate cyclase (GGDEF)-like protein
MGNPTREPLAPYVSWVVVGAGLLAMAVAAPFSFSPYVAYGVMALSLTGTLWGPRRNNADDPANWVFAFGAGVFTILGDALRAFAPTPELLYLPDAFSLLAYTFLIVAVVRMSHKRGKLRNIGDVLDTLLVSMAAWIAMWVAIVEPSLDRTGVPLPQKLLTAAYPCLSVTILFIYGILLASSTKAARPALAMFTAGSASLAIGDVIWATNKIGVPIFGVPVDLDTTQPLYAAALMFMAISALHPSMRVITRAETVQHAGATPGRMAMIGCALLVPPAAYALHRPEGLMPTVIIGTATFAMTCGVIVRMIDSIRAYSNAQETLTWQANHDSLTGMPNRALLETRLDSILTDRRHGVALLFFDLDRFKNVNDTYGHAVGDELLCAVSNRLQTVLRAGDLLARVSGDEFVAVFPDTDSPAAAHDIGHRVLATFATPFDLSIGPITVSSSIGVAHAAADRHLESDDLVCEADSAMYRSKVAGRNLVTVFDAELAADAARRVTVEEQLRGAADRGELAMVYQPIVAPGTGRTVGFEALMRWNHPELGAVSPAEFIPIAEESGQIVALGRWTLQAAIAQLGHWLTIDADLTMSVNLSTRQLRDHDLVPFLSDTLTSCGVPASQLFLEVTETAMIHDADQADVVFRKLKALGVRLSLDDFGTGFSSMSFLRRYPVDQVKIDRSFIAGLGESRDDEAICAAVVVLAQSMGLHLVGEGVETGTQRDRLVDLGCEKAQGWLYSKPLSATDGTLMLTAANTAPQAA